MEKMVARIAMLGLLVALLPGAAPAKDFEQRVAAESGGTLRVDLEAGTVMVESHDEEEVRVDALAAGVGSAGLDFDLSRDDGRVILKGRAHGWLASMLGGPHVRVRVRVPREFSVDLRTGGGAIELEDLEGDVRARSSGGAIGLERIEGDVDVETSGGAVEIGEIDGDLRARTSGGPIRIFEVEGSVDARTSGGPIEILDAGERVDARTSGGAISVRFRNDPHGTLETSGGSIDVEFPEGLGADLDARTSGGRVEIDPSITVDVKGRVEPSRVDADLNGGGDRLRLRTSGGDIHIRVR